MISFGISVIWQSIIILAVIWCVRKVFWKIVNVIRKFLYYLCGVKSIFTIEEKIAYGIIKPNTIDLEVIVLDPETQTQDELWENINIRMDMQNEQSINNPDEIYFQRRVKRRG